MNTLVEQLSIKPQLTPFQPVEVVFRHTKEGAALRGVTIADKRDKTEADAFDEFKERYKRTEFSKVQTKQFLDDDDVEQVTEVALNVPKKSKRRAKKIVIQDEEEMLEGEKREDNEKPGKKGVRRTPKAKKGVAELGPEEWVEIPGTKITRRLPAKEAPVKIRLSSYYMDNRKIFVNFINSFFHQYEEELESNEKLVTCDSLKSTESFSLLTHQKMVRDYLNLYTPYRGLLLFHKLGTGKTCTSIAIAEGIKSRKKVIVMTPKSLRDNYIEELKKCGDFMYKKKQYWDWVSDPVMFETLSSILNLPMDYIERKKGAWLMDVSKEPNSLSTAEMKSLDEQLNEMTKRTIS